MQLAEKQVYAGHLLLGCQHWGWAAVISYVYSRFKFREDYKRDINDSGDG